jgi:hypothetical protein
MAEPRKDTRLFGRKTRVLSALTGVSVLLAACGESSYVGTMGPPVDFSVACPDGTARTITYTNWARSRAVKNASVQDTLVADMTGDRIPELQLDYFVEVGSQNCLAASAVFDGAKPQEVVAVRGQDEAVGAFLNQTFYQQARIRTEIGPGTREGLALAVAEEVVVYGYDSKGKAKELSRSRDPQTILYEGQQGWVRRFILGAYPKSEITSLTLPAVDFSPKTSPASYSPRERARMTAGGFPKPANAPKTL